MMWDYITGEEFIKIERVKGVNIMRGASAEITDLIAEIPLDGLTEDGITQAEYAAEAICNAHNKEQQGS